ncbi:unnamed protein product [Linum tenue]|uniref:Uncharacterized protein n=1 Tax=Linum tenue TaxID=586396 RepID=A0AAV0GXD2_9ROSI|nr:unnamed protein product [Linum tenue]
MAAIDPFASVAELCSVSSSQDEYLRRSRFLLEPPRDSHIPFISDSSQDAASADLLRESTPIRMESPPESPVEENQAGGSPGRGVQASGRVGNDDDSDEGTLVISGDSSEEDSAAAYLSRDTYHLFSIEQESNSKERVESPDKSLSEEREGQGTSSCSGTPLLRTPQSNLGSNPALVVQRSIMSLEKLGSPLKGLTTVSEKERGNFCESEFLQTSQANLGIEPALVLLGSLKSLEKMGSTTKEQKQGLKSIQAAEGLQSAIAVDHTADGKREAAQQGFASKRKLESSGEQLESEAGAETNVVDNVEHTMTSQRDRSLGRSGKRAKEPSKLPPKVAALMGILNIFAAKEDIRDSTVVSMRLIDICKMHGMTFP